MNQNDMNIAKTFVSESIGLLDASMAKIEHCAAQMSDEQIWWRPESSINSVGNLLLHLAGNLQQWGVAGVSQQSDDRDRDSEFAQREIIPADKLLDLLRQTVARAKSIFEPLDESSLQEQREIQGFETTVLGAIHHTCSHFVGHTHQIIMLTRLQLGDQYKFHWAPDVDRNKIPV